MDESAAATSDRRLVWGTYAAAAILLVVAWEPIVVGRYLIDAYHNYDLGLYGQAIYLLSPGDLNPWLTVRETKIFNDHFEPILFVAAPLAKVIEPAVAGMLVELLFVLASPLAIVWLWKRGFTSATAAAVAIGYMLHNRGTLSALLFPFHPTTWAIFPAAFLAASLVADARRGVIAWLLVLCCCKQEFPLMGLMAAVTYLWRRQYRFAFLVGGISAAWLAGAVYLRPLIVGSVQDYVSARLLVPEGLWASVERGWRELNSRALGHMALPLVPVVIWTVGRRERPPLWLWLIILPPLGLRFLGRAWMYHYMPPLVPFLVLGLLPVGSQVRVPRWAVISVFALLAAVNVGFWSRSVRFIVREELDSSRPWTAERLASIDRGREYLKSHADGPALVQGNLLPRLVTRPEVYQIAGPHDPAAHTFRYVFLEKPPHGDAWPVKPSDIEGLLAQWRSAANRVIIDDEDVFVAEGEFRDLPRK